MTQLYSGPEVKRTARIQWLDVHQTAFETLKERLIAFPFLAYFQDDLETFVHCDASKEACRAVLAQKHGKYLKLCAFASRRFPSSESNLSTVEREALCIVWISVKWRSYLIHREVTIVTDQKSLIWLFSLKTPNNKLQRWSLLLSQFRFKIEHKAGILNRDADAQINKLPVWMTTLLLLLCVSSNAALTARTCQCVNKKLVGSLDLSQYARCEKLAEQPNPRNVSYEVFAMKKASNYFPATVCKATVQTLTVQKFFWGATDTVPSSQTKDLSPDECHRMVKNLDCFSNPMTRVPGTNAWAFNEKPDQTSSWLTTTKNVTMNCFVESTRRLQQEKDADITGIVGSLID